MTFDFKKVYSAYYLPPRQPGLVELPEMRFLAVRGQGDPNDPGGAYPAALQLLYGVAYTLRMAPRTGRAIEGYFPYVVPPLEGLWEQEGSTEIDYGRKADFHWISMIRLPDFVTEADFRWAVEAHCGEEGTGFFPGGAIFLSGGPVRAVYAPGQLRQRTGDAGAHAGIRRGAGLYARRVRRSEAP